MVAEKMLHLEYSKVQVTLAVRSLIIAKIEEHSCFDSKPV